MLILYLCTVCIVVPYKGYLILAIHYLLDLIKTARVYSALATIISRYST